jgi:PKD repeat protein
MNKRVIILCLYFSFCIQVILLAQAKNDYNWILGYSPNDFETHFGGVSIDFNLNLTSPNYFETNCNALNPAVLSSNTGKLMVYSNGCSIYNANHDIMEGGDTIAYGYIWETYCHLIGYPGTQNHILLPWPGDTTKAILFYLKSNDDFTNYFLLYATIKFDLEHPLGIVTQKDQYLFTPGTTALLTAVKHANGRDWWVMLPENKSNRFFSMLLDPNGVTVIDSQSIGNLWGEREFSSQAIFSPDGKKYIRFNPWKGLDIFDFDRCTGALSNPIESGPFSDPIKEAGGATASLDSRYLYVSNNSILYQFDLSNNNILDSKTTIATYDGFVDPFPTTFYQMVLAPDGKIYMFATNGVKSLQVINDPEKKGDSCNFEQHAFKLPAYVLPGAINTPYFRLGPDDGSSCDTLGINNPPIAYFKYEIDSLNPFNVYFKNLSYFNPVDFDWKFGDNISSTLKSPAHHEYGVKGEYNVCLNVKNNYGENTYCSIVSIKGLVATHDYLNYDDLDIFPNPFTNSINIVNNGPKRSYKLNIYSELGIKVFEQHVDLNEVLLDLSNLPNGMYYYEFINSTHLIKAGKLIKLY